MMEAVTVIDNRKRGFFLIDNEVIDKHGAAIGPMGIAVYCVLARHANKGGECFPSMASIASAVGISRMSVVRTLEKLEGCGLVSKKHRVIDGHHTSNVYTLLDVVSHSYQQTVFDGNTQLLGVVTDSDTNNTQLEQDPSLVLLPPSGSKSKAYPPAYEEWWKTYPNSKRKEGKGGCYRLWKTWCERIGVDGVLKAVQNYAASVEPDHSKMPSTFLAIDNTLIEEWAKKHVSSHSTSKPTFDYGEVVF